MVSFDNDSLRVAVKFWFDDKKAALARYGDISEWNTSEVTDMSELFQGKEFNDCSAQWMFNGASALNQDIGAWDVSKVTNMQGMFHGASAFNQAIGAWDVSKVTNMQGMFKGASAFNQDIGAWDVSKVTGMQGMFKGASALKQKIPWRKDGHCSLM
jgi:surface protein